MKHIKKKFLFELKLTEEEIRESEKKVRVVPFSEMNNVKPGKNQQSIIITDKNVAVRSFPYNQKGKTFYIPEPDIVLIYYNSAYINYKDIEKAKNEIFESLSDQKLSEAIINKVYDYFFLTSGFVMFLFTSIEAFINGKIPDSYTYQVREPRRSLSYDKEQIEKYIPFEDKLKNVIPEITKLNFSDKHPVQYTHIRNLKDFRDSIVHIRAKKDGHTPYDYLHKRSLNFKYKEALEAVKGLLNFYQPGYVEDCPCNEDW